MRFSWRNTGLALAVLAGMLALALTIWPASPQAREFASASWLVLSIATALGFLAAGVLADRHVFSAKALLVLGALARTASGLIFGQLGSLGLQAAAVDLLPALLALAAAVTIGPVRRRAAP